jgi:hypothetical protein
MAMHMEVSAAFSRVLSLSVTIPRLQGVRQPLGGGSVATRISMRPRIGVHRAAANYLARIVWRIELLES